jgi:Rrf2 family iron-sulfur cluster assembly transcriptional regulator
MIGRTGTHAIRAMVVLASLPEGKCAGAAAVAKMIDAPPNYLGKLLQTLARLEVVTAQRGIGGGYRLARDPRSIRLLDVIEPFEPINRLDGCFFGLRECLDSDPCSVHHRWVELREAYVAMLTETTIADVSRKSLS